VRASLDPLAATYDPVLVALSILVAMAGSYTALVVAARLATKRGTEAWIWGATSAVTMGGGIWSMHFIGMLAFTVPVPVAFDLELTLLSLLLPILVTGIGFSVVNRRGTAPRYLLTSGTLMGLGIVSMHYTGMAAMRMPAEIAWRKEYVLASILIAIAASIAALWLAFRLEGSTWRRLGAAVIMGAAVSGMHYTAMAAAHFHTTGPIEAAAVSALSPNLLAIAITAAAIIIFFLALISAMLDRIATSLPASARGALSARTTVLLVIGFFAIITTLAWGLIAWTDHNETLAQAQASTRGTAQLLAEHMQRTVGDADLVLRRIDRLLARADRGALADPGFRAQLGGEAREVGDLGSVVVADADRTALISTDPTLAAGGKLPDQVQFAPGSGDRRGPTIIGPIRDAADQQRFALVRTVRKLAGFEGLLVALVDPEQFTRLYRTLNPGAGHATAVFNTEGQLLIREPPTPQESGMDFATSRLFTEILPREPVGTHTVVSPIDGTERIASHHQLESLPLVVVTSIAREAALEPWRYRAVRNAAFALAMLIALTALSAMALFALRREDRARLDLASANATLDVRVQERTAELEGALRQLERALREKDVLMREVHHRVKNNLQMLQSMVRLTSRQASTDSQPLFMDIVRRIWALGQVHNQVYGAADLAQVDLAAYLSRICEYVETGFGRMAGRVKLKRQLDPVHADIDIAIPLGLVAVELLTNSYKHAFPGDRGGEIAVTLRQGAADVRFTVSDTGVGLADEPGVGSMGMRLIKSLAGQIDARLDISADHGTQVELRFTPVKSARTIADGEVGRPARA
jgi:NO-binding membrane sensor protein with MHYT domain/two-component sensor histidine kinase